MEKIGLIGPIGLIKERRNFMNKMPEVSRGAFDKIDINDAPYVQPYYMFHRMKFEAAGNPRQSFFETINQGFVYLLRNLIIKCSGYYSAVTDSSQAPFYLEVFSAAQLKKRQLMPIACDLDTTPGQFGAGNAGKGVFYITAPAAVDQKAYGVNASAQGLTSTKKLNYWFHSNDVLRVDFTTTLPQRGATVYLDCICVGYYIPSKNMDFWKGAL